MGSHRNWSIFGFNVHAENTKSVGVDLNNLNTISVVNARTMVKAVEVLTRHNVISKMLPDNANLVHYYVTIPISARSYDTIRPYRAALIKNIKTWASKSRITNNRGFRSFALKDVVIERNELVDGFYNLKFDVIFSNCSYYNTGSGMMAVHEQDSKDVANEHAKVLLAMLRDNTFLNISDVTIKPVV